MTETERVADAEFFYGLYNGVFKPQLVKVAIQLGFFDPLAVQSLNAQGLAKALEADIAGVERLADDLAAIGLIEKSSGLYLFTNTLPLKLFPSFELLRLNKRKISNI